MADRQRYVGGLDCFDPRYADWADCKRVLDTCRQAKDMLEDLGSVEEIEEYLAEGGIVFTPYGQEFGWEDFRWALRSCPQMQRGGPLETLPRQKADEFTDRLFPKR